MPLWIRTQTPQLSVALTYLHRSQMLVIRTVHTPVTDYVYRPETAGTVRPVVSIGPAVGYFDLHLLPFYFYIFVYLYLFKVFSHK